MQYHLIYIHTPEVDEDLDIKFNSMQELLDFVAKEYPDFTSYGIVVFKEAVTYV